MSIYVKRIQPSRLDRATIGNSTINIATFPGTSLS
jgi:hypothetical protein